METKKKLNQEPGGWAGVGAGGKRSAVPKAAFDLGVLPNLGDFEFLPFTNVQGVEDRTRTILGIVCSKSPILYTWGSKEPHPPHPWNKGE